MRESVGVVSLQFGLKGELLLGEACRGTQSAQPYRTPMPRAGGFATYAVSTTCWRYFLISVAE